MRSASGRVQVLAALILFTALARADDRPTVVVPGESKATANRFAGIDRLIAAQMWADALDELQAILDTAGDDLVPVDAAHGIRARQLVHTRIASLPADALQRYRERVDGQSRSWLEQGAAAHDEAVLRKVVEDAFCSRPAERALELLGDLAFERGHFAQAESWWQLLAPEEDGLVPGQLAYPRPERDPARVRAKQLMARHFAGRDAESTRQFESFKQKHGSARGVLGGQDGNYAEYLACLRSEAPVSGDNRSDWSTFGGDAGRGCARRAAANVAERLGVLCRGGPAYRIALPSFTAPEDEPALPEKILQRSEFSRSLAFHPVIVDGRLVVADATRVMSFDLRRPGDRGTELYSAGLSKDPLPPDVRFTLTAADGYVYARLGPKAIAEPRNDLVREVWRRESQIVCLSWDAVPGRGHTVWAERGLSGSNARKRGRVVFEGAPLVRDDAVYVAATRFEGGRTITSILCYAARIPAGRTTGDETPEPTLLWNRDISEVLEADTRPRFRHQLLTLAGPLVVCCTHAGAIVAVDATTGRTAWAARYAARPLAYEQLPPLTDLAPCVFAAGRLYAAPADGDGILCLDLQTGRTIWQRHGIDVVHLLGVGHGRLIFASASGLRALGAENGSDTDGWSHEARTDYGKDGARVGWTPAGRGLLAGDYVLWPVIDAAGNSVVYAVRQEDGEPDDNPTLLHQLPVGNLVYGDGCLASAGREELLVFVPPAWRLRAREQGLRAAPGSADAALALARSEADAGLFDCAAVNYSRAQQLAGLHSALHRTAGLECQQMWLVAGREAAAQRRWQEAEQAFGRASAPEFPPTRRTVALLEAAESWQQVGRVADAATAWQAVLNDRALRDSLTRDWITAGRVACRKLSSLDRSNLGELEKIAGASLAAAGDDEDLQQIAKRFPWAPAGRSALERLATRSEAEGRLGEAADYWRRLLPVSLDSRPALALARISEKEGCIAAARRYWQHLADFHGEERAAAADATRPMRDIAAEHLHALPAQPPLPPLPCHIAAEVTLGGDEDFIPLPGGDQLLTVRGDAEAADIVCRSLDSLREQWRTKLGFRPSRACVHDDLILMAGGSGVAALRRDDGAISWRFLVPDKCESLSGFRFVNGHVLCFRGGRLVAFRADSGEPWQVNAPAAGLFPPAPAGRFLPYMAVRGDQVWVQTAGATQIACCLDSGKICAKSFATKAWSSPPVEMGCALVTVEGSRRVACAGERERWTYTVPGTTTLSGRPPRLATIDDALLVLVETNIGCELQRLDRLTGRPIWPAPVLLGDPVSDPGDWAGGEGSVCLVEAGDLVARSLADGRLLWRAQLGACERPWRVERLADGLLAFPSTLSARHFAFRWLTGRVEWTEVPDVREAVGAGFPVICVDPAGHVKHRFNLAAGATVLRFESGGPRSLVPRAAAWRGTAAGGRSVQVSSRGVVVVAGPHAWLLSAAR
jgi:outer membrane protein assembly factor BamB